MFLKLIPMILYWSLCVFGVCVCFCLFLCYHKLAVKLLQQLISIGMFTQKHLQMKVLTVHNEIIPVINPTICNQSARSKKSQPVIQILSSTPSVEEGHWCKGFGGQVSWFGVRSLITMGDNYPLRSRVCRSGENTSTSFFPFLSRS
jgi:hypothetical protein